MAVPDRPRLITPATTQFMAGSTTPALVFNGTDPDSDTLTYDIQIDTVNTFDSVASATIDSYSETNANLSVAMGVGQSTQGHGQSFTGNGSLLYSIKFYLKKVLAPTGNATVEVYAHTGTFGTSSKPTGAALATAALYDVSALTTSFQLIEFLFTGTDQIALANGTNYVATIKYSGGDATNFVAIGADNTAPTASGNDCFFSSSAWSSAGGDDSFYVMSVAGPLLDKFSATDLGFSGSPDNSDPFTSGQDVTYTVQAGDALTLGNTYYWRVKAKDPSGSNTYGNWSQQQLVSWLRA